MDQTGGVNPTAPLPPDYMQSMGYAGAAQVPPSFMQPTVPVSPMQSQLNPGPTVAPLTYTTSSSMQDQFYPRATSADTRPEWQQQILAEVNAAQTYAPSIQIQTPTPQVELLSSNPMQISQNPYQMVGYSPQPTPQFAPAQQYQSTVPPPLQSWQQPAQQYGAGYQAPMGDIVIPLDDAPANGRRWLGVLVIVVVTAVILGGIGLAVYKYGSKHGSSAALDQYKSDLQKQAAAKASEDKNQDTQTDEPNLDFSLITPQYKSEVVTGQLGEQLQSSDGFVLYVKDVERNFKLEDSALQKDDTTEMVKVNFLVGNASSTQSRSITDASFRLQTLDDKKIEAQPTAADYEGRIETLQLAPGSKARMSVIFTVPKQTTPLVLVYEQSYTLKTQNTTVVSKIAVTLE